jgi:hypothetical protein
MTPEEREQARLRREQEKQESESALPAAQEPRGAIQDLEDGYSSVNKSISAKTARKLLAVETRKVNPLTKRRETLTVEEQMFIKMIEKALKGNISAFNAVMDRAYGKPKQEVETTDHKRLSIAAFVWAKPEEAVRDASAIDLNKLFQAAKGEPFEDAETEEE